MRISTNAIFRRVPVVVFTMMVIALTWLRLSYGVELSDEAYYIAEAKIVYEGAIPFITNWTQAPGYTLLYFWLIPLYKTFTGSLDGIFLFMRQAFIIFKLLVLSGVFFLLKKHIKPIALGLFLVALIPFVPHSIPAMSYNTLSYWLLLLSASLALGGVLEIDIKYNPFFFIAAGIIEALSVLSYPTQIVNAAYIGVIILLISWKKDRNVNRVIYYALSGIMVAVIVSVILTSMGGGVNNLFQGIETILGSNYFDMKKVPFARVMRDSFQAFIRPLPLIAICFAIIVFILSLGSKIMNTFKIRNQSKSYLKSNVVISLIVTQVLWSIYIIATKLSANAITGYMGANFILLPLIYLVFIKENRYVCARVLCFIWVPSIITLMITVISSWNGISSRLYWLFISSATSIILAYYALLETSTNDELSVQSKNRLTATLTISLALIYTVGAMANFYFYVYRDNSLVKLNTRVESGVYKGMMTTQSRSDGIQLLEKELNHYVQPHETVLYMETVPMAYLMTEAKHCTPSTWDMSLYSYAFNNDDIYQHYFEVTGQIPDKIVYVFSGRDKFLSIDTDGYKFNDFVNSNYMLQHNSSDDCLFPIKVYERIRYTDK